MKITPFEPKTMARAEVFRAACERNALRRAGGLPLLPIHDSCEQIMRAEAARIYAEAISHYESEYRKIRAQVIDELQERKGVQFGASAGGRWVIDYMARERFDAWLRERGFRRPSQIVVYGSGSLR